MDARTGSVEEQDGAGSLLEGIVEEVSRDPRVYFLSEVAYDTAYFNASAYENLLRVMEADKGLTGILVDGAITRLDRPEFLCDQLTYWDKDEEFCTVASEKIPNRLQYESMLDAQENILKGRLAELKARVPQADKIVLSLHSEDVQYTASAVLNELLIRRQGEIGDKISELKRARRHQKDARKGFEKEYLLLKKGHDDGGDAVLGPLARKIETCTRKIDGLEEEIQNLYDEQKLYREKKVRPAHQLFTRQFIEGLFERYAGVCKSMGIDLVTSEAVIDFGGMNVDYSHCRHKTWNPEKGRDGKLVKSLHGKQDRLKGIDVVLESGHFGIGFKQLQRLKDTPDETNFRNRSSYDSEGCDDHVTIVLALPFEDQQAIGSYVKGRESVRMSGGKPMGTRKIAATDRYSNNGVTGLTILTKDRDGVVGTEWMQYQNFVDGSVLRQPDEYTLICASSDEHIGAPEERPIVRDGWVELYRQLVEDGTQFRGRRSVARGYINAGDVAEANSRKWQDRYHHKRDPHVLMRENVELLSRFRPESIDDIVQLAKKMTNDAMGGSVESMRVILERVADYYDHFLMPALESRGLKWAHVCTTGNHTDAVFRDLGIKETDFFVQRLKARGIGVCEAGIPGYCSEDGSARVFVGGYSSARVLHIPDYGNDVSGDPLFGPIGLVVQHDPKGSGLDGVVGAGKNSAADLAIAGHTHDNCMEVYKTADNRFSVAYKLATLQGVTPTEKYYASSVPRTQAAHILVMPMPGDFSEKAVPAYCLRELGLRSIAGIARRAGQGRDGSHDPAEEK